MERHVISKIEDLHKEIASLEHRAEEADINADRIEASFGWGQAVANTRWAARGVQELHHALVVLQNYDTHVMGVMHVDTDLGGTLRHYQPWAEQLAINLGKCDLEGAVSRLAHLERGALAAMREVERLRGSAQSYRKGADELRDEIMRLEHGR